MRPLVCRGGRTSATTYRVRRPCSPGYEGKWCVAWRSPAMPGLAFWYFDTRREARRLRSGR